MRRIFATIALGLAATTASLAADADTSPVAPPTGGMQSLAPILKKITPAVVHIEVKGRLPPDRKYPPPSRPVPMKSGFTAVLGSSGRLTRHVFRYPNQGGRR